MKPKILLVNPPIYDFAAYDFWLKPYGMLSVAGFLRGQANFTLFDYMDRLHPFMAKQKKLQPDTWGRGRFYYEQIPAPPALAPVPRYYRRFGLPRNIFQKFLTEHEKLDFVFIQTTMTYWYQGIKETIEDLRRAVPKAKIILGGNYVTLCAAHAKRLGADFIVIGADLQPLWKYLSLKPQSIQPALWEAYENLNVGVLKLSDGCPFNCTYCSVPKVYGKFRALPMERSLAELNLLAKRRVSNLAFYDDALLYNYEQVLVPFLREVIKQNAKVNFHSPNALNARFITPELADLMVEAGFKTFYLGFESASSQWQQKTGSKVSPDEFRLGVEHLITAGAQPTKITAYQILGHPYGDIQQLEDSMHFINSLGIRGMLADFSPIPGTPDGEYCRKWVNMEEPLLHNKTAFPVFLLGFEHANYYKDLQRKLNRELS
jgi:radical SAM superfamily enzyme YgiQ (UPF0313 family)